MRKYNRITDVSSIRFNNSYEGEPLEIKLEKVLTNNEPIDSSSPIIYTNRADGVQPAYDIRADRFDIAIEAMDKVSRSRLAKREEFLKKGEIAKGEIAKGEIAKGGVETTANASDPS